MKNALAEKLKKVALALALVIVINIFFNVGLDTFYPAPDYDEFCGDWERTDVWAIEDQEVCISNGGIWNIEEGYAYCEEPFVDCWDKYQIARAPYDRNSFIVLTVLGTATLLTGMFAVMPMAVSNGLLYGGTLSVLIGTMRYWSNMDDYLRFIVSGIALIILVLVGIKKLKD
jgi:hypothetical protein